MDKGAYLAATPAGMVFVAVASFVKPVALIVAIGHTSSALRKETRSSMVSSLF